MNAVPEWMRPPRPEGWYADDLDHLPEAPRHTELLHGALVFRLVPQRTWHSRTVDALVSSLERAAPNGIEVDREITVRLDQWNRLEPDFVVTAGPNRLDLTFFTPDQVLLVGEVESPESAYRDRTVKLRKYAEAGIAHYWRVEEEDGLPVVHAYELDGSTRSYTATGIHRRELHTTTPYEINLKLLANRRS